jgi:hypothetical protein
VSTPTIPILELTPSAHQPHPRSFFSCTYVEPILQPLCFDIWGVYTPLALPAIPSSLSPSPYPLSFHTLPHSFALFCTHAKLNSLVFNRFRTLCSKHVQAHDILYRLSRDILYTSACFTRRR